MKRMELRKNEHEKYEVIKKLVDTNGNKNTAAIKLGISVKQINRLILKYKENGKSAFVHGNRSMKTSKTFDKAFTLKIVQFYKKILKL